MNKIISVEKIDELAIGTHVTGAKVILYPRFIEVGGITLGNIREEDSDILIRVGFEYLDSEMKRTGYFEDCSEKNIRTKESVIGSTDYKSDETKAWFVDELCGFHIVNELPIVGDEVAII